MFLETVRAEGLSHLSYVIGDGIEAAVIDPRRDCRTYLDIAAGHGAKITAIFETHRNEDYVVGSSELASLTGADIYHGEYLPFEYGKAVKEGDSFRFGNMELRVLETPGHTDESISLVLADLAFGRDAVAVFTGDALFIGDVGRTDFYPDRAEEVAGLLYDSLFGKILPLGDHVILHPAHGAGSVCGGGMADRDFSTLGYERRNNPALQVGSRDEFIGRKVAEVHDHPPYFSMMEELNLRGAPPMGQLVLPDPLSPDRVEEALRKGWTVLDVRDAEAYAGAHLPGSLCIPLEMVPSYAGWFLDYDRPIVLVAGDDRDLATAIRYLNRIGYDRIEGHLAGGTTEWETSGRDINRIPAVNAQAIKERLEQGAEFTLLDVRSGQEFEESHIPDSTNLHVGCLRDRFDEIPGSRPLTTFCSTGQRATIAASLLENAGFGEIEICLGSMEACESVGCPIERLRQAAE